MMQTFTKVTYSILSHIISYHPIVFYVKKLSLALLLYVIRLLKKKLRNLQKVLREKIYNMDVINVCTLPYLFLGIWMSTHKNIIYMILTRLNLIISSIKSMAICHNQW